MSKILKPIGFWALVVVIVLYAVFPFYYAILTSMRTGQALFSTSLLPDSLDFSNYVGVFEQQPFAWNIWNSIIVAVTVVLISLFLGVTAAYALGRVHFKGRGLLLMTILAVSMFPQVAVLSGMYEVVRAFGLYNTMPALVLSNLILTLPFTVWVLTTFMKELPRELEEAAFVDGASPWTVVRRVFMPLMWPAMVTTGLLAFIAAWNEFMFALAFTSTIEHQTIPVGIANFTNLYYVPWGDVAAASVVVTVPLIALVLFFQRHIIEGLTQGAVKE